MDIIGIDEMMQSVRTSWEKFDIYSATQLIKAFSTGIFLVIGLKCPSLDCMMEIPRQLGHCTE